MADFSPEDALDMQRPAEGFLCNLDANEYQINFLNFLIQDYDSKAVIFEVGQNSVGPPPQLTPDPNLSMEDAYRNIRYQFSEDVLKLPSIQTSLVFSVGPVEVPSFRMIERYYFRNRLIKSFDFGFGFCIPGSTNTWDAVYAVPALDDDLISDMIDNPYGTVSDSFYFVDGKLVKHNKAQYKYIREDNAESKSYMRNEMSSKGGHGGAKGSSRSDSKGSGAKFSGGAKADAKGGFDDDDDDFDDWSKESDYY